MAKKTPDQVLKNASKKIEKAFELEISSVNMKERGEDSKEGVVKRTQILGKGVDGSRSNPLKPLSDKYKERRRIKRKQLGPNAKPNKSNLTFTGQLLKSLSVVGTRGRFIMFAKSTSRTLPNGEPDSKTNSEILKYVQRERTFLELTKAEINKIKKEFREKFRKKIRDLTT